VGEEVGEVGARVGGAVLHDASALHVGYSACSVAPQLVLMPFLMQSVCAVELKVPII